ncbi:hypothetical protein AMTR_s00360p00013330 [Amborella trichopoda]|uniref:Uncharacterized protein n=1 Tax=Amborella trichopoda TaxID=13333 RepID=W1NUJ5_AMBTC|nr:hypothetical protein AMTR_s00360p00013330 [Amborella trichopoda]
MGTPPHGELCFESVNHTPWEDNFVPSLFSLEDNFVPPWRAILRKGKSHATGIPPHGVLCFGSAVRIPPHGVQERRGNPTRWSAVKSHAEGIPPHGVLSNHTPWEPQITPLGKAILSRHFIFPLFRLNQYRKKTILSCHFAHGLNHHFTLFFLSSVSAIILSRHFIFPLFRLNQCRRKTILSLHFARGLNHLFTLFFLSSVSTSDLKRRDRPVRFVRFSSLELDFISDFSSLL